MSYLQNTIQHKNTKDFETRFPVQDLNWPKMFLIVPENWPNWRPCQYKRAPFLQLLQFAIYGESKPCTEKHFSLSCSSFLCWIRFCKYLAYSNVIFFFFFILLAPGCRLSHTWFGYGISPKLSEPCDMVVHVALDVLLKLSTKYYSP